MRTLSAALLLSLAGPAFAQKEFGFDNRKASGQPYLTPEETVKRMKVAPEFEVKLFAGEPQVINPVAFTIDEKGRVWVVECFEYPSRTPKGKAPRDRIVILEDTDGDGVCDKRTVFAEGKDFPVTEERKKAGLGAFDLATGIEVGHGGVFVGAPPYLWFIENKDDKPGKFETLLKGFGSQDTHETLNTFQWGPDGWLYGLHGIFTQSDVIPGGPGVSAPGLKGGEKNPGVDAPSPPAKINGGVWRYHPKTKKFEVFAEGTSNPWGMDWRNTDGQFILACCVIPHLFHVVPGGIYKRQAGASYNPYAYGYINEICDHTFHKESGWAHAGLISLDAPHIPEKYRDSVIFGSIHGCSVKRNTLKPNGSTYTASRADDFLVSGDKNVRPINLRWGPNGDIYLIDWHDQNPCHQAAAGSWDYERGRVYRIQVKGTQPKKAEDLGSLSLADLVRIGMLDPNPYRSRTAVRLVGAHKKDEIKIAIAASGVEPNRQILRLFQIIASDGDYEAVNPAGQIAGFKTYPAEVVAFAVRMFAGAKKITPESVAGWGEAPKAVKEPVVRRELASLAVKLADTQDVRPLLHALMEQKEDAADPVIPHLIWYAYEKVLANPGRKPGGGDANPGVNAPGSTATDELRWLAEHAAGNPLVAGFIIPRAVRRLVATGKSDDLDLCVKFAAELKDPAARRNALDGLAVALKGQTVAAPPGWAALQKALADDSTLAPLVKQLAVSFRDPKAITEAFATVRDAARLTDDRAEAVRRLAALKPSEAAHLFVTLAKTDPALPVRIEAARGLAAFDSPALAGQVLAGWADYPPPVRAELVNALAGRKEWAMELLRAMEAKTVDRRDVTDNTVTRIQAFNDKGLNALIEKAWGRTRPTPKELDALIDKMRGELAAGPGSITRGKLVFDNQCAKCHKFDGRGNEVGPPLDGAARDIEYLLANVIDPNRVIGAPYFLRIVRTEDGRVEQGLLAEEDDQFVTLKVENAVLKKFAKKDLDGPVKVVEKSMMPEGLTAGMSTQDFRDLVRYVMANPFVTDVTANGKPLSAGVPGRIALTGLTAGGATTVAADLTATAAVKTQLLVGCSDDFEVKLDGRPVGSGGGAGKKVQPDQQAFAVTLPPGPHTLTVTVKSKDVAATLFARFLDPDRRLTYPAGGATK